MNLIDFLLKPDLDFQSICKVLSDQSDSNLRNSVDIISSLYDEEGGVTFAIKDDLIEIYKPLSLNERDTLRESNYFLKEFRK